MVQPRGGNANQNPCRQHHSCSFSVNIIDENMYILNSVIIACHCLIAFFGVNMCSYDQNVFWFHSLDSEFYSHKTTWHQSSHIVVLISKLVSQLSDTVRLWCSLPSSQSHTILQHVWHQIVYASISLELFKSNIALSVFIILSGKFVWTKWRAHF